MYEVELATTGGSLLAVLRKKGFEVEVVDDYAEVEVKLSDIGRLSTIPLMDPGRLDFEQGEAFWLFLKRGNKYVASVSAKVVDLRGETLASYTRRTSKGQYQTEGDPIIELDPIFDVVRNRVVYVGQIQTEEKQRQQQNVSLADLRSFLRFMKLVIMARWQFEYMFGFMEQDHIGLNRIYSFSTTIRQAIIWRDPPPAGRRSSQVMLVSSRRQVDMLFRSEFGNELSKD